MISKCWLAMKEKPEMSWYLPENTKTGDFNRQRTLSGSFFVIPERLASICAGKQTNMFVCLFVQTLRNYEELPGECPLQFEIARLSVLGKISWHSNKHVCLFVQTLRNYEELPGECPQQFEIARLSALGKISWHFRFPFAADRHFYLSPVHFRLLHTSSQKRGRPRATSLLIICRQGNLHISNENATGNFSLCSV